MGGCGCQSWVDGEYCLNGTFYFNVGTGYVSFSFGYVIMEFVGNVTAPDGVCAAAYWYYGNDYPDLDSSTYYTSLPSGGQLLNSVNAFNCVLNYTDYTDGFDNNDLWEKSIFWPPTDQATCGSYSYPLTPYEG